MRGTWQLWTLSHKCHESNPQFISEAKGTKWTVIIVPPKPLAHQSPLHRQESGLKNLFVSKIQK